MKLNRLLFNNKDYVLEDDIDFSNEKFDGFHLKSIDSCHVKITGQVFEDLLMLEVNIDAKVIGVCAYSLEDVPLDIKVHDNIEISDVVEDDDVIFYEKNSVFDIDPYILSLIVTNVPQKIVKKGAKLPSGGKGYRVLSEEEYQKEESKKVDPRWAALDNLDLD